MNVDMVMYLGRRALETALMLAAPCLITALVVGFLVAMVQAVTSIRDMTMGLVLKLGAIGLVLLMFSGWMLQMAMGFANEVFGAMQQVAP